MALGGPWWPLVALKFCSGRRNRNGTVHFQQRWEVQCGVGSSQSDSHIKISSFRRRPIGPLII